MITREQWDKLVPAPRPLQGAEKWNVFLSYRSANRPWVVNLYDVLKRYDHAVFLDQVTLVGGDQLIAALEDGLSRSQAGVLVWSKQSRDSSWVRREYQTMEHMTDSNARFRFVPIRVDDVDLPPFASNRLHLDFSGYPDGPNGGELLRLLHAVVGRPLSDDATKFAVLLDEASKAAANQIAAAIKNEKPLRIEELFSTGGLAWEVSSALGCKAAEGLARLGCNDQALDVLRGVCEQFPRSVRPKQLTAHVLTRRARGGGPEADLDRAQEILGELYQAGERDAETLGLYGSTWMERFERSNKARHLEESRDLYRDAFRSARDDYYTGINAAAKSVLLGTDADIAAAAALSDEILKITGTEPRSGDYWLTATIGEVFLLKRNYADAGRLYRAAVAIARSE